MYAFNNEMYIIYLTTLLSTLRFYLKYDFKVIELFLSYADDGKFSFLRMLLCCVMKIFLTSLWSFPCLYVFSWPFRHKCENGYMRESRYALSCANTSLRVLLGASFPNISNHFSSVMVFTNSWPFIYRYTNIISMCQLSGHCSGYFSFNMCRFIIGFNKGRGERLCRNG